MPSAVRQSFSKSGTAHLLAISGGNIALLALILVILFRLLSLPRRWTYGLAILGLAFYCALTGAANSILRATLMISLYLAGFILKRESEILTSLAWAAIFILLYDPLQLFDLGFRLSFISVFMIAASVEKLEELDPEGKVGFWKKIRIYLEDSTLVSLAAWVGVTPLLARALGMITPVAIFANLALVPYFGILQIGGFMYLAFGSLGMEFEQVLGYSLYLLCRGALILSDWFVTWPWSHFYVRPPGAMEMAIFYVLVLLWAFGTQIWQKIWRIN
jgi:competence protein ComEC